MTKIAVQLVWAWTLALGSCAQMPATYGTHPSAEPVVAAERAFEADTRARGIATGFRTWAAPDAIILQPDPVKAHTAFESWRDDPNGPSLNWWPEWAGIAESGELGFTTGPFVLGDGKKFGHYFSVWKKQPDGSWRWIFDAGADNRDQAANGRDAPVAYLQAPTARAGLSARGWREVGAAEQLLANEAAQDAVAAYTKVLADDAHMQGGGTLNQPAIGRAAAMLELGARAMKQLKLKQLGGEASQAGDLAFTYGDASWIRDGQERRGHYGRIWQKRTVGWRIVFDEIIPLRK
jgi:ketosteroid isomerase-like protein